MLPVSQKYNIEEQDRFYKQIYNDLSIIFEQSEQSVNFDEQSLTPIKLSFTQLYTDQKYYQSSTEEENISSQNLLLNNEATLINPSTFKRMAKSTNGQILKMEENIGNEADDTKNMQFPFELYVKFMRELQQKKFSQKS